MKKRVGVLNIMDPWEYGTEKPIQTSLIDKEDEQYLFYLSKPLSIKGKDINYLVGELRDKEKPVDLTSDVKGTFVMNMVYSDDINEQNFLRRPIKDFRGNFLLGEVIFS